MIQRRRLGSIWDKGDRMMPKTEEILTSQGNHGGYLIYCPGCKSHHVFDTRWTFNGDFEQPTFSPSMLVNQHRPESRCHSFVTDGKIQYLSDSFHDLAGQTVELPEID
jgi:hypothetical protein